MVTGNGTMNKPDTFFGLDWFKPVSKPPLKVHGVRNSDWVRECDFARKLYSTTSPIAALTLSGTNLTVPLKVPTSTWWVYAALGGVVVVALVVYVVGTSGDGGN